MKSPSPAFSLYPKDILSDEACTAMTHAEFGMYVRLLMHAWLEGSIPDDPVKLQRLLGVASKTFEAAWPAIAGCWTKRDGRLLQLRMERERDRQRAASMRQAEKGKKGAKSRWDTKRPKPRSSRGHRPAVAEGMPGDGLPSPSPSPSPSPIPTNERTTEPAAIAPGAIVPIPKPGLPDWNREFADDFREVYGGPPSAQLFTQVKAVAKQYGWLRTRPALRDYMAETAVEFLNVPKVLPVRVEAGERSPPASRAARQRLRGMTAMAKGGLIDERGVAQGAGGADGGVSGSGLAGGSSGEARGNLPPGAGGADG